MAENVGGSWPSPLSLCHCSGELAVSPLSTELGKLSALATELGDDGSVLTVLCNTVAMSHMELLIT